MRLVFLGPPGVGKGTQVRRLCQAYGLTQISTGDMFRMAIVKESPLGIQVKSCLDAGRLVPDDLTSGVVRERLAESDARGGYVLDGFPRTLAQADALAEIVAEQGEKLDRVLYFELSEDRILERVIGRRNCPNCQRIYHTVYQPPKNEGVCDCGATLVQRKDDTPETAKARIEVYRRETVPLVGYYEKREILSRIDAGGSVDFVSDQVSQALGSGGR